MTNPVRGEFGFDAGGQRYTLVYSVNALCALEEKLGTGATAIAEQMADPSMLRVGTARTLFWAGLLDHHEGITEEDAGRLMTEIGITTALQLVGRAMSAAFPKADGPLAGRQPARGRRS